jgi:predicted kinase
VAVVVEVLALHGSPGSGKSTLAHALSDALRVVDLAHGVIDLDELSLVHPYPGRAFTRTNLRAIWPHYVAAAPDIRVIIPTVFADEEEVDLLRAATPGASLMICELTAPKPVLEQRVTEREPTEESGASLRKWIDLYHARSDHERIRDFQVTTHPGTVDESVRRILELTGWVA